MRLLLSSLILLAAPAAAQTTTTARILWELEALMNGTAPFVLEEGAAAKPGQPYDLPSYEGTLAALLRPEAAPVERAWLDGDTEGAVPFHSVPGGIVLGLTAKPADTWKGATLEHTAPASLHLRTSDGRRLALPRVEPWFLAACLDFVSNARESDVLIDIAGPWRLDIAPEFEETPLARVLDAADRAPRRAIPHSRAVKSVILDRAVVFDASPDGTRIELRADVEIRFYTSADSLIVRNALKRLTTWTFVTENGRLRPAEALPEGSDLAVLTPHLEEVASLAAWIGFLRWARENDPAGVAQLRAYLSAARRSR